MLFGKRNKIRNKLPAGLGAPDRDPLDAVPLVAPGIEARQDAHGLVQIRGRRPTKGRLDKFFAQTLRMRKPLRLDLDERGSFFWGLIDNHTDFHEIARRLDRKYRLTPDKAREATVMFACDLMRRGIIQVEIKRPATSKE